MGIVIYYMLLMLAFLISVKLASVFNLNLFVLLVCLLTALLRKLRMNFHEIFGSSRPCKEE